MAAPALQPATEHALPSHRWVTAWNAAHSPERTALRVKTTLVLGFLFGILLSPKLWVNTRYYPLVPALPHLPAIPYPLDYVGYGALLVLLFASLFSMKPRVYIFAFCALIAVWSLWDETRWQPWAYQYWLMMIALGCYSWRPDDLVGRRDSLNICRLIMGFTYVYSGSQKFNPRFASEGLPWVLNTLGVHVPKLGYGGWVAAAVEVSIGLCLLSRRFRKIGIVNGTIMHLFILFSFGPWGRNWNSVVWPWNIVQVMLIFQLFWNADATIGDIVWRNKFVFQKVALVLFGIMPSLSFWGLWPSDLSVALYNANLTEANILVSEQVKQQLPPFVQRFVEPISGHLVLRVQQWAFGEMNVPPFAELQSYTAVAKQVCKYSNYSADIRLTGREKDTLLGRGKEIKDSCFGMMPAP